MHFMTRTTIDLKDEHRAILRAIAVNRGWRGFSRAVEEAIDFYLEHHAESEVARRSLLERSGAWSAEEAGSTARAIAEVRRSWPNRSS
jgi:hypothetical protein